MAMKKTTNLSIVYTPKSETHNFIEVTYPGIALGREDLYLFFYNKYDYLDRFCFKFIHQCRHLFFGNIKYIPLIYLQQSWLFQLRVTY